VPKLCRIRRAVGQLEECPEERCAFWEPGGAVLEGRCAFDGIDVAAEPDLANLLLGIRSRLEEARTVEEEATSRRLLDRLLRRPADE